MKINTYHRFKSCCTVFNETSAFQKKETLRECAVQEKYPAKNILPYHDALLFTLAYPESEMIKQAAEQEMRRLINYIENADSSFKQKLSLSGIAGCPVEGGYSLELLKWLLDTYKEEVEFHSFDTTGTHPKEIYKHIFPEMEFEIVGDEKLNSKKWLTKVSSTSNKHLQLKWLVENSITNELSEALKDQLFDSLKLYVTVKGNTKSFSRSYGRIKNVNYFYHTEGLLKRFDEKALVDKKLPQPKKCNENEKRKIIDSARTALALLNRETDPITNCDKTGIVYYELERGISIALFSMVSERRLPLESYIGFMMFKNGYPMAYGGAWLFGKRSLLGINIFENFRGGESAFVFAQLLRTYKQAFGATYFEVEPYQFGKNNPEGITSGAFWFYYRFGFKPINQKLNELAQDEAQKIILNKSYRSSTTILRKFTAGNVAVNFTGTEVPFNPSRISKYVSDKIANELEGSRPEFIKISRKIVCDKLQLDKKFQKLNKQGLKKLAEFIYCCFDLDLLDLTTKKKLRELIVAKSHDEYKYIHLVSLFNFKKAFAKACLNAISY